MYTYEEICVSCGERFLFRTRDKERYRDNGSFQPLCFKCRSLMYKKQEREREENEREERSKKAEDNRKEFLEYLKKWNVVPIETVLPSDENTLYIIGNGFDLMHRVPSSYYHFRDSLGKGNELRCTLESYITVEDIWADLENALAHFDIGAMTSEHIVDMWLNNFEAYKEDSGAAEYFMSIEAAAHPIITVANELPRQFRRWVEKLSVGTGDRPLKKMFVNGKVLNFNYTEFVEKLYGVSKENICYIHGCRVKQKGKSCEPLILGHVLDASDEVFEMKEWSKSRLRGFKRTFVKMAQTSVMNCISEYDEYLTKDTGKIIKAQDTFFRGLEHINTVISIGHSFSETDWNYFRKIKSSIADCNGIKWYFGCYGLRDLNNLRNLLIELDINKSNVMVFRTDTVVTTSRPEPENRSREKRMVAKSLCKSKDEKWEIKKIGNILYINNAEDNTVDYSVTISNGFKRAFFAENGKFLFVVMCGVDPGVLLLKNTDDHWRFVGEFSCDHQHLLVSRLQHVFMTKVDITFVYNNRIRRYSLTDGTLICNKSMTGAKNNHYDGKDIKDMFLPKNNL